MDDTDPQLQISEGDPRLSDEDARAHEAYLAKIGINNPGLDPDYKDRLREISVIESVRLVSELAAELPESQAEVETTELKLAMSPSERNISADIEERIRRASLAKHGNREEAVAKTVSIINGYRSEAITDIELLNLAFATPQNEDNYINANLIRTRPELWPVLAKYLRVNSNWAADLWLRSDQPEAKEREQFFRGMVIDLVMNADDPTLEKLTKNVYALAENRFRYWNQGKANAEKTRPGREVVTDPKRTIGSHVGRLLHRGRKEAETSESEGAEQVAVEEPLASGESPFKVPTSAEAAVAAHLRKLGEIDKEVDWDVEQGFVDQATAELRHFGGKPIRNEQGEVIGVDKDDKPRGITSSNIHHKRPRLPGFGVRADISDSGRRVKETYDP